MSYIIPLRKIKGRKAAWYLYDLLSYPIQDVKNPKMYLNFEEFKTFLHLAIIRHPNLYREVKKPKRSGGQRTLLVPIDPLKDIQKRIDRKILRWQERLPCVSGFSGGSIRDALYPLVEKKPTNFCN